MRENLIFDIGMHIGNDSEFYLAKGFDVVAVEADPRFCAEVSSRLSSYVRQGRLTIVNAAISDRAGMIEFFTYASHDDWGTASRSMVVRNDGRNVPHQTISVNTVTMGELIGRYGCPYYLKIDIEGMDHVCLAQTRDAKASPRYVSFEMDHSSVEAAEIGFSLLREMGYRRFKIINQARNGLLECPNPPREGRYILRRFDTLSSGLFGEETPGTWLNSDEVQTQVRHIVALKKWLDSDGLLATNLPNWAWNIVKSHSRGWPSAWYDVHATM